MLHTPDAKFQGTETIDKLRSGGLRGDGEPNARGDKIEIVSSRYHTHACSCPHYNRRVRHVMGLILCTIAGNAKKYHRDHEKTRYGNTNTTTLLNATNCLNPNSAQNISTSAA